MHERDIGTFGKVGTWQIVRLIFLYGPHSSQIEIRYLTSLGSKLPSIEQSRHQFLERNKAVMSQVSTMRRLC